MIHPVPRVHSSSTTGLWVCLEGGGWRTCLEALPPTIALPHPACPLPPRAAARDVQAVLKAFDGAREWPDVMKCITRLQRTLEAKKHERFPDVPDKLSVGKRLAQCLHPSLPAGIHLTALDVYRPGPTGLSSSPHQNPRGGGWADMVGRYPPHG